MDIIRLALGHGLSLTLGGILVGLAGAFALARLLSNQLFGVQATDPATFVLASLLFLLVAAAASYVPARRASRIDPVIALRQE